MFDFLERMKWSLQRRLERLGERLAALGAALVWPIERAFAATFGRLMHVTERFERVEDWLVGLVRLVTWPLRMAGRMLGALVPASLRDRAAGTFGRLGGAAERLGAGLWRLVERLNLDAPIRWLAWLLQPVWRPVAAVLGFLYAWTVTRPYRTMLWGLPVVALLAPVLAAIVWGTTWGRESVAAQYRESARAARDAADYEQMRFFERKLALLGVDTKRSDYQAALALEAGDDMAAAAERMELLAPADEVGYGPAHQWLMLKLLSGELDRPRELRLRQAGAHLDRLVDLGAKGPELDLLRGIWLAQSERLEEASEALAPLIVGNPMAALYRLEIDVKLGRGEEAQRDARAVSSHMQDARRRGTPLTAEQYRAWATAEQLLGNGAELARVLRAWWGEFPEDDAARQAMAALAVQEFGQMLGSSYADPAELARRLKLAAELTPQPALLEQQVLALYARRREAAPLAAMFELLAEDDDAPPALLGAVGTAAALGGEVERARGVLARAVERDPELPAVWNNYA